MTRRVKVWRECAVLAVTTAGGVAYGTIASLVPRTPGGRLALPACISSGRLCVMQSSVARTSAKRKPRTRSVCSVCSVCSVRSRPPNDATILAEYDARATSERRFAARSARRHSQSRTAQRSGKSRRGRSTRCPARRRSPRPGRATRCRPRTRSQSRRCA